MPDTQLNLLERSFNKEEAFADIYSTTCKQHHFKIGTIWAVTSKRAMEMQTVNHLMSSSFL